MNTIFVYILLLLYKHYQVTSIIINQDKFIYGHDEADVIRSTQYAVFKHL